MLLGELPKKTRPHQEHPVETRTGLPPTMQDGTYVLFLRWAPGDTPDFHHHMLVATDEVVETIEVGERVGAVAIDDQGRPWVDGDDDLLLLDPDAGSVVGSVEVEGQPREVAAGDGSIWSVPHDAAVLTRVDPS